MYLRGVREGGRSRRQPPPTSPPARRSHSGGGCWYIALPALLIAIAVVVVAWVFFTAQNSDTVATFTPVSVATNIETSTPIPSLRSTGSPSPTPYQPYQPHCNTDTCSANGSTDTNEYAYTIAVTCPYTDTDLDPYEYIDADEYAYTITVTCSIHRYRP